MNKKELITPFLVIGLTALFAGICIIVYLTKGKSAKWISRKMVITGLLLNLTAVAETGCYRNVLCYKFAPPIPKISDVKVNKTRNIL